MTYAHRDHIFDADTHMMEPAYWLSEFADEKTKPFITPLGAKHPEALVKAEQALEAYYKRQADPQLLAELEASFMSMAQKGFVSLGAFDRDERKRINDLLGFDGHIVFPTTSFDQVQGATQPDVFAGSVEALNPGGLHYFCETDKRMLPAAYVPFRFGPEAALKHVESAINQDFSVIMIDTVAPAGTRAFTHPDFDPVWARIQDAELAVTIHVGYRRWLGPCTSLVLQQRWQRSRP